MLSKHTYQIVVLDDKQIKVHDNLFCNRITHDKGIVVHCFKMWLHVFGIAQAEKKAT